MKQPAPILLAIAVAGCSHLPNPPRFSHEPHRGDAAVGARFSQIRVARMDRVVELVASAEDRHADGGFAQVRSFGFAQAAGIERKRARDVGCGAEGHQIAGVIGA